MVEAMEGDAGVKLSALRVDGGASANDFLLQTQANISDAPVVRPRCVETTATGAAYLAGLATGFWKDLDSVKKNAKTDMTFVPNIDADKREGMLNGWRKAVKCSFNWARE